MANLQLKLYLGSEAGEEKINEATPLTGNDLSDKAYCQEDEESKHFNSQSDFLRKGDTIMSKYKDDNEKPKQKQKKAKNKESAMTPYEKKKALEKKMMDDLKQRVAEKEAKRLADIEKRKVRPQSQQEEAEPYIKVADPEPQLLPYMKMVTQRDPIYVRPTEEEEHEKMIMDAMKKDNKFQQFEEDLNLDDYIQTQMELMNADLDNLQQNFSLEAPETRQDEDDDNNEAAKAFVSALDPKQILRGKAIETDDMGLLANIPMMSEQEQFTNIDLICQNQRFNQRFYEQEESENKEIQTETDNAGAEEYWKPIKIEKDPNAMPEGVGDRNYAQGKEFSFKVYKEQQDIENAKAQANVAPKVKKEPMREKVQKYDLKKQIFTRDEVENLKYDFQLQFAKQKTYYETKQAQSIALLQRKQGHIIKGATEKIVVMLKSELQTLLGQTYEFKQEIADKNEELERACKHIYELEQAVLQYGAKYQQSKIEFDIKKDEMDFLNAPADPNTIGLSLKVDRYINARADGHWQDPRNILDMDEILSKPMRFYSSYCSLSLSSRTEIMEDQLVIYYKCVLKDQEEVVEHMKSQVAAMIHENKELEHEVGRLNDVETDLRKEISNYIDRLNQQEEDSKRQAKSIAQKNLVKMNNMKEDWEKERKLLVQEIELNKEMTKQMQIERSKMAKEYKTMQEVIKVPRLHYKEIEKIDYDTLTQQHQKYKNREQELYQLGVSANRKVNKEKLRTEEIMKKTIEANPLEKDLYQKSIDNQIAKLENNLKIKIGNSPTNNQSVLGQSSIQNSLNDSKGLKTSIGWLAKERTNFATDSLDQMMDGRVSNRFLNQRSSFLAPFTESDKLQHPVKLSKIRANNTIDNRFAQTPNSHTYNQFSQQNSTSSNFNKTSNNFLTQKSADRSMTPKPNISQLFCPPKRDSTPNQFLHGARLKHPTSNEIPAISQTSFNQNPFIKRQNEKKNIKDRLNINKQLHPLHVTPIVIHNGMINMESNFVGVSNGYSLNNSEERIKGMTPRVKIKLEKMLSKTSQIQPSTDASVLQSSILQQADFDNASLKTGKNTVPNTANNSVRQINE